MIVFTLFSAINKDVIVYFRADVATAKKVRHRQETYFMDRNTKI
jgi:hypothetical protein